MSRLYVYKIRYDDGTAPHVANGLLSLALCKPALRATAQAGDTVIAFAAKSMCADQRLVYAAVVARRFVQGTYYRASEFQRRRDCIYRWSSGAFHRKKSATVHASDEDLVHDLGEAPGYSRANVLVSENYRYFADTRPADHGRYPAIARLLAQLGQGHRVNHGDRLREELERYLAHIWATTSIQDTAPSIGADCRDRCSPPRKPLAPTAGGGVCAEPSAKV